MISWASAEIIIIELNIVDLTVYIGAGKRNMVSVSEL